MHTRVFLYLLLLACLGPATGRAADAVLDFRIVIDASTAMRELDPAKRLETAVKMMNGLLPRGSRAGIWTYGRYVEMVAKWGEVDQAWREQADLAITKIRTGSTLSHLEQALARARVGWQKPNPGKRRVLLLVSASGVDVSRDPLENAASRDRVLGRSLADLKAAGAEVHSIALGAKGDVILLQRLAIETGGSFREIRDTRELLSAFYQVHERVQAPDTIRLDGNDFKLDADVRELRLLLFNANKTRPALLVPPNSPALSAARPRQASWRRGDGFDLVIVNRPEAGSWRIDADMDPLNKLMVQSQMELRVSGIPVRVTPQDGFTVAAELWRKGKKIRRNSYLRFVDFRLTHIDIDGVISEYEMEHTTVREDKGRYLFSVAPGFDEGRHRFIVSATTSSFDRRQGFAMDSQWPAEVSIGPGVETGQYRLRVSAREQYLDPAGLVADVEIVTPGGKRERVSPEAAADGSLNAEFETSEDGLHRAEVRLSAQSHRGEIVDINLGAVPFIGVRPMVQLADPAAPGEDGAPLEADSGFKRKLIGFAIVGVNLTILMALLIWWLIRRRRKAAAEEDVIDEPSAAPAEAVATDAGNQPRSENESGTAEQAALENEPQTEAVIGTGDEAQNEADAEIARPDANAGKIDEEAAIETPPAAGSNATDGPVTDAADEVVAATADQAGENAGDPVATAEPEPSARLGT